MTVGVATCVCDNPQEWEWDEEARMGYVRAAPTLTPSGELVLDGRPHLRAWDPTMGQGCREENPHSKGAPPMSWFCTARPALPVPSPLRPVPSALQVLCVFMKLRAQLQRWLPLVLLQSCEQVPKRRHSLMSGGYTGGSWRHLMWLGFLPALPWPCPAFLPWHPGWPGTVWKPGRQAQ